MTDDHKAEALARAIYDTDPWFDNGERLLTFDEAKPRGLIRNSEVAASAILARFNVTARDEWEWGVRFEHMPNDPPAFIGAEESARYFMGRPNNSVLKCAKDDWVKRLVRRHPASEWEVFDV